MFTKILIANRGEIACRIIRSCRDLGIQSVAVFSEADAQAPHVLLADEAHCIGPSASSESYLVGDKILEVARKSGAEAIHPGYGFLSENSTFRRACEAAGIGFVGPSAEAMEAMGEKTLARETMSKAGVPIVPGTEALEDDQVLEAGIKLGFPIMIKAAAGGGGKGMRVVHDESELVDAFQGARRTARSAFNDERVYLERFVERPRHIEIQVLLDQFGNGVYLFERECSVQRRHQKVIEEAPASILSEKTRAAMGDIAVKAAQAIGYVNAGTFEFLVDPREDFYFLEMNTRLQVEHPVTEEVTGVDLVAEQLRIAAGEKLQFTQEDLSIRGHAIECRIYAEDPSRGYIPSPGHIHSLRFPEGPGVRVDAGIREGSDVSEFYDPMLAKLVVWGASRPVAIARMRRALQETYIGGIRTNLHFLDDILGDERFVAGGYDTGLLNNWETQGEAPEELESVMSAVAAAEAAWTRTTGNSVQEGQAKGTSSQWKALGRRENVRGSGA